MSCSHVHFSGSNQYARIALLTIVHFFFVRLRETIFVSVTISFCQIGTRDGVKMDEAIQQSDSLPPQITTTPTSSTSSASVSSTKKGFFRRSPSPTPFQMRKQLLPQAAESTAAIMTLSATAAVAANADKKPAIKSSSTTLQQSGSATGNLEI